MSMQGFGGWTADQINSSMGMGPGGAGSFNQGVFDQSISNSMGPSSGYGTVGGYPSFGDPAPVGTYSPGGGLSPFSGQPVSPDGTKATGTKGLDPRTMFGGAGADSGIAAWGSQPIYSPPQASFPAADPMNSGGYGGGGGGGAWDTSDMWGRPYAPPAAPAPAPSPSPWPSWIDAANNQGSPQTAYDPSDPSTWGAIGWSPEATGGATKLQLKLSDMGLPNAGGGGNSTIDQFGRPYAPPGGGGSSSYPVTPAPQNYPSPGADLWGGRVNLQPPGAQRDSIARQLQQMPQGPAFNDWYGVGGLVPGNGYDPVGSKGVGTQSSPLDEYGNQRFFPAFEPYGGG